VQNILSVAGNTDIDITKKDKDMTARDKDMHRYGGCR
jgi:hypothetical protein